MVWISKKIRKKIFPLRDNLIRKTTFTMYYYNIYMNITQKPQKKIMARPLRRGRGCKDRAVMEEPFFAASLNKSWKLKRNKNIEGPVKFGHGSEIGAQVRINLCYFISLRYLIRSRVLFYWKRTFSFCFRNIFWETVHKQFLNMHRMLKLNKIKSV